MNSIYLDYAAATPVSPEVRSAMEPYFSQEFYNPSATYLAARHVRQHTEEARHIVAQTLGAKPPEIIFTAGATEANNLAIQGIIHQFPNGEVLISAIEHESIREPAKLFNHKKLPVNANATLSLDKLSGLISDKTVLISVMLVNNELGTIQPLREIASLIKTVRAERQSAKNPMPLYLHTDAAQAGNYLDLHVSRLGVDLMSLNGGKIYGPKQSGALYLKTGTKLKPLIVGGGQEFGLRSGTENVPALVGFSKALQQGQTKRRGETERLTALREYFETALIDKSPTVKINGLGANRAPHITSVIFSGQDNERLMMELDEAGIQCALGSACSASKDLASQVLKAIGLSEAEARSTLRFSFGSLTTESDLEKTVETIVNLTVLNR